MPNEKIGNIGKKIDRIENDVNEIKIAVGRIETKLDERTKAVNQRLNTQEKSPFRQEAV